MRFVLQDKIGEGAMGVVYKALDTETGETVAVKILPVKTAAREELSIARKIAHRNVCRVFDLHDEGDRFFISMEFLAGETLRSYLDRVGRVDVDEMLRISGQLMDGLEEAHRIGILHRDLKPENIMMLPSIRKRKRFAREDRRGHRSLQRPRAGNNKLVRSLAQAQGRSGSGTA